MQGIETDVPMTTPNGWGDKPLAKRNGHRGLLPSTWVGRAVRLGYVGIDGRGVETSGTLLDYCGCGPVFNLAGSRVLIAWDRIAEIALVAD